MTVPPDAMWKQDRILADLYQHWTGKPPDWRTNWPWWQRFERLLLDWQALREAQESYGGQDGT